MRISVGKSPSNHPVPQEEINQLLVRLAQGNRRVVRLKGGDPFIFGRGSEEAIELSRHGIPFDVVPGISAAQGCAAALKVPLTHRGLASGVRYVTGHCRDDIDLDFDWNGLSDPDTTALEDATRPLILYQLDAPGNALRIVRRDGRVRIEF